MLHLNQIKDYRLCKQGIISFDNTLKKQKESQIIFHIGKNNMEDICKLINSQMFKPSNFKSYYHQKILVSENKKIRRIINQQNHYKEINEKTNYRLICRNTIGAYKNANLFVDLTPIIGINMESTRHSALVKMRECFEVIFKTMNQFSKYKYKMIVVNVDGMNSNEKDDFLNFFNSAIRKKADFFLSYFKDITFLFISPMMKTFFKFTVDDDIFKNKVKITQKIEMLKSEIPIPKEEFEDPKEEIEEPKPLEDIPTNADKPVTTSNTGQKQTRFEKVLDSEKIVKADKKETKKTDMKEKITKEIGIDLVREEDDNPENIDSINSEIDTAIDTSEKNNDDMTEEELMNILLNKEEFKKSLVQAQENKLDGYRKMNAEQLKIQQDKLRFRDVSLKDLKENFKEKSIDTREISDGNIKDVINKEILKSTLSDFDKSYMEKKFNKDIVNVIKAFNEDSDIGVYVKDIKLTDNNSDMNKQQLLEVEFKDDTNVTHKFKINIPEVVDGKFMFINGTKKVIMKQITYLPIVKLEPDRVQITTNYNKHFITRFGQKFSEKLDYLKKLFIKYNIKHLKLPKSNFDYKFGNSLKNNGKFIVTAEYCDISGYLFNITIGDYYILFDQTVISNIFSSTHPDYDEKLALKATYDKQKYFCMGYLLDKSKLIVGNILDKMVYLYDGKNYESLDFTLSSLILNEIHKNIKIDELNKLVPSKAKSNTKLTYSRMEINNKKVPVAIVLAYELGLLNLLERYEIEYNFDTKNRSISIQDDIGKIRFKDGYLYFDNSKIRNTMLLSGLLEMDCEEINFSDMNTPEPYLDYFQDAYNSRNAAKGFHNSLTLLIDPITKEILEELNLPTNVYDVLLYANTLLEDISFSEPSDVNNFRIRGAEQIPAMLYKVYADAFKHYKDSKHAKNPVKITVDPDILTKKLQELKTIESYSALNPSLEFTRTGTCSMKGLSGINLNDAYTKRVRAYNENQLNLIALNGPEGNQIGIVKQLTYDPKIANIYGFIDTNKPGNGSTTQYDITELLNVSTTTHADPPRISMQSVQQKHIVSIKEQTPALIGTGIEKTIPYLLSDEFVYKAKDDGVIESIDTKNEVAIIRYKNGKKDLIDLGTFEVNNSNGGFYISQKFELLYGVNQKFSKGAIIAKNPNFFIGNGRDEDLTYALGRLTKVAITSGDFTLDDSSLITSGLSKAMSTKMTMRKTILLDKDSTVSYIVKENSPIKTNEPLIVFERSFNDNSINDVLSKIGDEFASDISEISKNELKCKYTGTIRKVNIYYTLDIEEYSPSIQKILKEYINRGKAKKKIIESIKGTGMGSLNAPIIDKQTDSKIRGEEVGDGILFEFFIEYEDDMKIGDKCVFAAALKTICAYVCDEGEEPYSEFREEEPIEAVLSPLSINSRMCLEPLIDGYVAKALIELKRKCKEILGL